MQKGVPQFSDDLEVDAKGPFGQSLVATVRWALEDGPFEGIDGVENQSILDPAKPVYPRLVLDDGSVHWPVRIRESAQGAFVSVVARDRTSGAWYAQSIPLERIQRYEHLPPMLIERLPEPQKPFGFADLPASEQ